MPQAFRLSHLMLTLPGPAMAQDQTLKKAYACHISISRKCKALSSASVYNFAVIHSIDSTKTFPIRQRHFLNFSPKIKKKSFSNQRMQGHSKFSQSVTHVVFQLHKKSFKVSTNLLTLIIFMQWLLLDILTQFEQASEPNHWNSYFLIERTEPWNRIPFWLRNQNPNHFVMAVRRMIFACYV